MTQTFDYAGHSVAIAPQRDRKGKMQYWFYVDGLPIQFVSRLDTAKRLAVNFIDVVNDSHYRVSRQCYISKTSKA